MSRSSKYTREVLAEAVEASASIAAVLRYLGVPWSGGMHAHISRRIKHFGLDTGHFTGQAHRRGFISADRLPPERILVLRPAGAGRAKPTMLRRALVEVGIPYRCANCGIPGTWQGKPLILQVDHVDGNYLDCRPANVRFLCPNCHSQTASWAGRNRSVRSYRIPPSAIRPIAVAEILTLFDQGEEALAS
jgi:predicted RNA-binding Zn-ribbon protein involved in translation (DUF1610 family)